MAALPKDFPPDLKRQIDILARQAGQRSTDGIAADPYPLRWNPTQQKAEQIRKFWIDN